MKIKSYNFLYSFVRCSIRCLLFLIIAIFISEAQPALQIINPECEAGETTIIHQNEIIELADDIVANRKCPCQCNNYLPGSSNLPACFGCSAGKAEISYVLESLESGIKTAEIMMDLNSPIIIDDSVDLLPTST